MKVKLLTVRPCLSHAEFTLLTKESHLTVSPHRTSFKGNFNLIFFFFLSVNHEASFQMHQLENSPVS